MSMSTEGLLPEKEEPYDRSVTFSNAFFLGLPEFSTCFSIQRPTVL